MITSLAQALVDNGLAYDGKHAEAMIADASADFTARMRETGADFDVADLHDFCTERWGFQPGEDDEEELLP